MADTPNGETVTPLAPSNEPGTPVAPSAVNNSADVENAKREAEQARIRANQLENENARLKAEQQDAQRKQLEEKEEFKTLYEQTQARLKEIEDANTAKEHSAQLQTATQEVLKDYPAAVVAIAKTAGLSLSDDSDAARAVLKAKLDEFKTQVGGNPAPRSNNPHQPTPVAPERTELVNRMRGGDKKAASEYIGGLSAIQRMKEIARNGA